MFQNLSLRRKLALIALAPLLALFALALLRIQGDLSDSSDASNAQSHTTVSALTGQLFEAFRNEAVSNQNAFAVSGVDEAAAQAFTDEAASAWLAGVQGTSFASLDETELERFLANIADYRSRIDTAESGAAVFAIDQEVLESIERYDGLLANSANAAGLDDAADLTTVQAAEAELQLLGLLATHTDAVPAQLPAAIGAAQSASDGFGLRTTTALPEAPGTFTQLVSEFSSLAPGDEVTMSDNDWRDASDARAAQIADARSTIVSNASAAAAAEQSEASSEVRTTGLLFLMGLLLGALAFMLVARSVRTSLNGLKDEATHVASGDLPRIAASLRSGTPVAGFDNEREIDGVGDDEFGEVATEIRSIRESAAGLGGQVAELQAGISDTFVNLARRNQALVDRQLEAIDTLEAEERDPDRLALMYRVDHLATRMRRNAESLLVLADAKTPERHSAAVELREVLRVAIGEVEDYRRIVPISLDDLMVPGHRAQDLAHLLAELMENAAQQSPPGTAVDVTGGFEPTTRDYIITIRDHGTGIAEDQLTQLNNLLATPPTSTLTISHSIGLQVVSRLSHTLGLDVRLAPGPEGGVIAAVRVPAAVATEWGVPEQPSAPIPEPAPAAPIAGLVDPAPAEAAPMDLGTLADPAPAEVAPMDLGGLDAGGVELPTPAETPVVDLPGLDLPSLGSDPLPPLEAPAAEIPSLDLPPVADLPEAGVPAAPDLGGIGLPETPDFSTPAVPDVSIGGLDTPAIPELGGDPFSAPDIPDLGMPSVPPVPDLGAPPVPEVSISEPQAPTMPVPEVDPSPFTVPAEPEVPTAPTMDLGSPPASPTPMPEPQADPYATPSIPDMAITPPGAPAPDLGAPATPPVEFPAATVEPPPAQPPAPAFPAVTPEAPAAPAPAPVQPAAQAPAAPVQPPMPQAAPPVAQPPAAAPQPVAPAPAPPAPAPMPTQAAPQPEPIAPQPQPMAPATQAAPVADAAPETTSAGLTKRKRSSAPVETFDTSAERTAPSQRTPDQVKNMLSRYKTGLERGRSSAGTDGES